jgi:hypothetical protein
LPWWRTCTTGNHERHFNLAQAFWHGGERQRAYNHFALAHQLAKTDEERHDVISMLEYLREQDDLLGTGAGITGLAAQSASHVA